MQLINYREVNQDKLLEFGVTNMKSQCAWNMFFWGSECKRMMCIQINQPTDRPTNQPTNQLI